MEKKKIITKTIWILSFVSLCTDIASEMLYPVMPIYLKSIGFGFLLIGILEGIAEAIAGLSKGYFGNLSDSVGKRVPFIRFGYGLSAIAKPMLAVFSYIGWVFFARTLDRLGKGMRTSARDAMLSDESTSENKGKVFGFHRSMDTLGAAIGPCFALLYLFFYPQEYRFLFLIAFIPGIIAIMLTFFIKENAKKQENVKKNISFFQYLSYWKRANIQYKRLIIGLLAFTLFNSSDALLLLVVKFQGASDLEVIGFYIFFNLIYAISSYPAGILADKIGLQKILIFGLFLFSVVYGTISFTNHWLFLGILFALYGIYYATTEGIAKALISNFCEKQETATAIGFYSSFSSIFALLASIFAGFLWEKTGSSHLPFLISSFGVFCVAIYLVKIFSESKSLKNNSENN